MASKRKKKLSPEELRKAEERRKAGDEFELSPHLLAFLSESPFYAEISRRIHKRRTRSIPTLAVMWNRELDTLELIYNQDFLAPLSPQEIRGCLMHEYLHLIFGHLAARRREPPRMWNIATDLAINSLIYKQNGAASWSKTNKPLPRCGLVPGQPVWLDDEGRTMTSDEKAARPLAALIESMKPELASENYFNQLMAEAEKHKKEQCPMCGGSGIVSPADKPGDDEDDDDGEGSKESQQGDEAESSESKGETSDEGQDEDDGNGSSGHQHSDDGLPCPCCGGQGKTPGGGSDIDSFDDHSFWDAVTEDVRDYVEARVRDVIEGAVNVADQQQNGWGSIPAEMQAAIRKSISRIIPWRTVLRQFVGTLLPGDRATSIKRINRRYPYVHPGVKRGRTVKLLVAIDQSGSVNDEMLAIFFAELASLTRHTEIDVLPFDFSASHESIYKWRKNQPPPKGRVCCGGTNFDAVTEVVNDPRNRGRWDGVLIATDGECGKPGDTRIKRGWVIAQDHKLYFDTNELQVFVSKERPMKGAWR